MKTKILSILSAAALAAIGAVSCDEGINPLATTQEGSVSLNSLGIEVSDAEKLVHDKGSRAAGPDVNEFIVRIYNSTGATEGTWTYGEMPEVVTLPVGQGYRVAVESHEVKDAEWEHPYFAGEKTFDIENLKITNIGVVKCTFASLKVSVRFSDELRAVMGNDVVVKVSKNAGGSELVYTPSETRAGYFSIAPDSKTLLVTFTGTVKGYVENITKAYTDVEAGQHRVITFGLRSNDPQFPDEVGKIDPSEGINVDVNVEDSDVSGNVNTDEDVIDPGKRPGTEDPVDPPTPPTPGEDEIEFTSETLDLAGLNQAADYDGTGREAKVHIVSPKQFAKLEVEIVSQSLNKEMLEGVGLSNEFDLAAPGQYATALANFGFPIGEAVTGEGITELDFDITQFVPLLLIYAGEEHTFIITVTDKEGNSKSATLKFQA